MTTGRANIDAMLKLSSGARATLASACVHPEQLPRRSRLSACSTAHGDGALHLTRLKINRVALYLLLVASGGSNLSETTWR